MSPLCAQETAPAPEALAAFEATVILVPASETPGLTDTPTVPETLSTPGDPTATVTPTPTVTPTVTATAKAPNKAKGRETATLTDTVTITPTETMTSTVTATVTDTATPTVTPTSTPGVFEFSVNPKPLKGKATVRWELTMSADRVTFKVYTSSFRLVRSRTYTRKMNPAQTAPGPVDVEWDVTDDRGKPLVPGTYFFYLTVKVGRDSWEARDQAVVP